MKRSSEDPGRRPTVALALVSALVLAIGVGQLAIGPSQVGVTTDEPFHVLRLQSWLDGGEYIPPLLNPLSGTNGSEYVYGPAFAAFAHVVNVITGQEAWSTVSTENTAMITRHLSAAFLALMAALTAGLAVAFATGSRLLGFWTAAALLAIPLWTGMGFFNPKDTAVAAGFTLFTAALVAAQWAGPRKSTWSRLLVGCLAMTGVFFAVGTRLAMWLPIVIGLIVFGLLAWKANQDDTRFEWPAALIGSGLGLALLIAIYPSVFAQPVEFVTGTLGDSSDFDWEGFTLTAGELLPPHPPWWYLPAWGFASTPLLIGLVAISALVMPVRNLWRRARQHSLREVKIERREAAMVIIAVQLLVLPLGSIVMGSTMYSGLRQHLYMVPAIAMIAGIGASYLIGWARSSEGQIRTWLVTGTLSLALVVPMAEQLTLFPYNYIYVNPVAGLGGVSDRWEGDYWWSSRKEASDQVPDGETVHCGVVTAEGINPYTYEVCRDEIRPYASNPRPDDPGAVGSRWSLIARRDGATLPPSCTPEGMVTRWLRGERVVISYIARC